MPSQKKASSMPAFLFDVDGTLIDSVYEHVEAWAIALRAVGIVLPNWELHRRIGMSGQSFLHELLRKTGRPRLRPGDLERLEHRHTAEFSKKIPTLEPLPGARELLNYLSATKVSWAIATTGNSKQTRRLLKPLHRKISR